MSQKVKSSGSGRFVQGRPPRTAIATVAVPALLPNTQDDGIRIPNPFTPSFPISFVLAQFRSGALVWIQAAFVDGNDVGLVVQTGADGYAGGDLEVWLLAVP